MCIKKNNLWGFKKQNPETLSHNQLVYALIKYFTAMKPEFIGPVKDEAELCHIKIWLKFSSLAQEEKISTEKKGNNNFLSGNLLYCLHR